jgi:Cd2+/Zn2+-exporting ATPase
MMEDFMKKDIDEHEHCDHEHEHEHCGHDHEHCGHDHEHEHGCGCCHHDGDGEEEPGLSKILLALALFTLGIIVEHVPFIHYKLAPVYLFEGVNLYRTLYMILYFASFVICGRGVIRSALSNIRKGDFMDEQFLMSAASIGAICIGKSGEAVAIMLFYCIGEFFQDYAVDRSRDSIKALVELRADTASVLKDGQFVQIEAEDVEVGAIIQVKNGERIPLDGVVLEGTSSVDTSVLTGESMPREIGVKDQVLAGMVNIGGVLKIQVTKPYGQSAVSRILELTQRSQAVKARAEKFISRFAKVYTPIVCFSALAVAIAAPLVCLLFFPDVFAQTGWSVWVYRALMFLVVSCPCALVISVPLAFFSGIGLAGRNGILIKGSNFVEALSKVDTGVFDKTGTLTKGIFDVTSVISGGDMSEDELIALAAHAEHFSNHPISKSIKKAHLAKCGALNGEKPECCTCCERKNCEELNGYGIKILLDGKLVLAGNRALMQKEHVEFDESEFAKAETAGTVVYIARDGRFEGAVVISDSTRENASDSIKALRKEGVRKTIMLTGDNENAAVLVAKELGIDDVYAGLLPEDKVEKIEDLIESKNEKGTKSRGTVMFVGDGVNDGPVLARSDVGVAMGAMGSDAAIEAADVVIMDDKLIKLSQAVKISRKTMRIVYQNIWISLGVKAAVMVLGALGITNMWFAVFGDVGVCFIAVLNALRMSIQNAASPCSRPSHRPTQSPAQ